MAPPSRPVRAMMARPFDFAAFMASMTFFELPEVEMATRMSPGLPRPSTWREKTWSKP